MTFFRDVELTDLYIACIIRIWAPLRLIIERISAGRVIEWRSQSFGNNLLGFNLVGNISLVYSHKSTKDI